MPKKSARKKSASAKKASSVRTVKTSPRRSRVNIHHSHPLYFVIAILLALVVFLFVQRIVTLRDFADDASFNAQENAVQMDPQMMMHPSPSPSVQSGY